MAFSKLIPRSSVQIFPLLILLVLLLLNPVPIYSDVVEQIDIIEPTVDVSVTADNPFRGFVPFMGNYTSLATYFPHSMEFFTVPLKDLMNGSNSFTFDTGLEPQLNEIASRNHQAIFRVYLDYPTLPTGVPDYLVNGLLFNSYTDYGGGQSPDYTNDTLISAVEQFIGALGNVYDGDIRIAYIQIGLLGHWGEWHTYPNTQWFPDTTIQNRILNQFDNSFNQTHILVRIPAADSPILNMGFHDDSFAFSTIGPDAWQFYPSLVTANADTRWQQFPIGGEIYPPLQTTMWDDPPPAGLQDFEQSVNLTHASWMLYYNVFANPFTGATRDRALQGSLQMGYQFSVSSVKVTKDNDLLSTNFTIGNNGSAPFYYPLQLIVDLVDTSGTTEVFRIDNFNLLPATNQTVQFDIDTTSGDLQDFEVQVRLDSPNTNIPIYLANANPIAGVALPLWSRSITYTTPSTTTTTTTTTTTSSGGTSNTGTSTTSNPFIPSPQDTTTNGASSFSIIWVIPVILLGVARKYFLNKRS